MKKFLVVVATALPMLAMAHPGHDQASGALGLVQGFLHPLLGLDHLFALLAIGIVSTGLSPKQQWILPIGYVALMGVGFYGAHGGWHLVSADSIESVIALSLVVSATVLLLSKFIKQSVAASLLCGFAVFHGLAHGLEVPVAASVHGFALGFLSMSALCIFLAYKASVFVQPRLIPVLSRLTNQ